MSLTKRTQQAVPQTLRFIVAAVFIATISINRSALWLSTAAQRAESCHLRELELCTIGSAAFFQNPNGIPMAERELARQCEYIEESVDCFESFGERCLTGGQMGLAKMFAGNIIDFAHQFCSDNNTEFKRLYMEHVVCLRQVQKAHQNPCVTSFQVAFEGIHKINNRAKFDTACCNYNRLKECIMKPVEDKCGPKAVGLVKELMTRFVGGTFGLLCRGHEPSSESCLKLLPAPGTAPHYGRNTSAISRIISSYANAQA